MFATIATMLMSCSWIPKPETMDSFTSARQSREAQMRERWEGHLYAELVKEMGRTGNSMTVPSKRGENRSLIIFGINDPISRCIDSFGVINGDEPIIDSYSCR
ncbi:MAG: hypothetical protein H8E21_06050 [Gammaproteobacteria bacterium]|nr:hypothetical protein [Gammaproteobacteria bacterium]